MGLFDFLKKKKTDVADHPVVNSAQDTMSGVVDSAQNTASSVADSAQSTVSGVADSVGSAVDSGVNATAEAVKSVTPDSVDQHVDNVADAVTGGDSSSSTPSEGSSDQQPPANPA